LPDSGVASAVSAQLAVSKSHEFDRIRWSDGVSDETLVREYRVAQDWFRVTRFGASARRQARLFSTQHWVDVLVECQQVNEKAPSVNLRPKI
jgi:hypothetical protein